MRKERGTWISENFIFIYKTCDSYTQIQLCSISEEILDPEGSIRDWRDKHRSNQLVQIIFQFISARVYIPYISCGRDTRLPYVFDKKEKWLNTTRRQCWSFTSPRFFPRCFSLARSRVCVCVFHESSITYESAVFLPLYICRWAFYVAFQ